MKKEYRMVSCIFTLIILFCALPAIIGLHNAFATSNGSESIVARNLITIYNQGDFSNTPASYGREDGTLYKSACGLFSINHAMQWVGISAPSPEDMASTDKRRDCYGFDAKYFEKSASTYGYNAENLYQLSQNLDTFRNKIMEVFRSGSAITFHVAGNNGFWGYTSGHYCLGVGISNDGSKVHIVDSSALTTLGVLKSSSYNGYYFQNGSFLTIDKGWDKYTTRSKLGLKSADIIGGEYWVDTAFIQSMQINSKDPGWTYAISNPNGNKHGGNSGNIWNTVYSENCTYKAIKAFNWHSAPSSGASIVGRASVGDIFQTEAVVKNSVDNMWVKVRGEEKYVFAGYKWDGNKWFLDNSQTQYLQFVSDNASIEWPDCNVGGKHTKGEKLALLGAIKCSNNMLSVQGEFYNGASCWGYPTSKYPASGTSYYVPSSSLDYGLSFSTLPASNNLKLVITVEYLYDRGQKTGNKTYEVGFSISDGGEIIPPSDNTTAIDKTYRVKSTTTWGLNVRSMPTTSNNNPIALLNPGDTIACTKRTNYQANGYYWLYGTSSTGITGWISENLDWIEVVSSAPTTAFLDVNGWLDASFSGSLGDYGTVDVYINGNLVADDVNDYYSEWPVGTTYEIKDIKACLGYKYWGPHLSYLSGTIESYGSDVELSFDKDYTAWGGEMPSGNNRIIPDGDYIIASASDPLYYLDIAGVAHPADNNTNVGICRASDLDDIPEMDIWTVTYNTSNGFYTIRQKGTDMYLDVAGDGKVRGKNVQVYSLNSAGANEKTCNWAISQNGRNGYRIQARSSGFSLDVEGSISNGANVQQYSANDDDNQSWVFIPYNPAQPIENGRYILLSTMNQGYELDVSGDTGDVENGVNVQLWDISAVSQYNSFDFEKLSNGYYKIIHAASGKSLGVSNGGTSYGQNIALYDYHGGATEQWAILSNVYGYVLCARNSGYALDIFESTVANNANARQWPYLGYLNQTWIFEQAEHTVTYDGNGGNGEPGNQTKYFNTPLTVSSQQPTRTQYDFIGWGTSSTSTMATYQPGGSYTEDVDLKLYAIWKKSGPSIVLSQTATSTLQKGDAVKIDAVYTGDGSDEDLGSEAEYIAPYLIWSCLHEGDTSWDNSATFIGRRDSTTATFTPGTRTGNYIITCESSDKRASATCTVIVNPAPVTKIELNKSELAMETGNIETLIASITPSYTTNTELIWSSSDTNVASVSNGVVTAHGQGTATITCVSVSNPNVKVTCTVTVTVIVPVSGIVLDTSTYEFGSVSEGSAYIYAEILPENATDQAVTWSSSNTKVATVNNGTVTPLAPGYARIFCASANGAKGICDIIVHSEDIIQLPETTKSIEEEAFRGTGIIEVIIPDGAKTIGTRAFANCRNLAVVCIPSSVTSIADDAFNGSGNVAIIADDICAATEYAQSKNIPYLIGSMPEEVDVYADTDTLVIGQTTNLNSYVRPYNAPQTVRWSIVEGADKATIQAEGDECVLTANRAGRITVAGTAINGVTGTIEILIVEHPTTYDIWFDANGGECNTTYKEGRFDEAIGTLPTPTWEYHTFDGWYTKASGGSKVTASTVFTDYSMESVTLYAHWTNNVCTITFDANGGSCVTTSREINCGATIGPLPTATRDYYTLTGWYTASSGGDRVTESTVCTTNTRVYAHWTLNDYGEWSGWSTTVVSGNDNRQVETDVRSEKTGTKTIYNYNRYLYWHSGRGYYMASYGSNWATSQGYSGSWQYVSTESRYSVDHTTDGQNVYYGETRDGNHWWYNESITTEAVYSDVTYYRYRDRVK